MAVLSTSFAGLHPGRPAVPDVVASRSPEAIGPRCQGGSGGCGNRRTRSSIAARVAARDALGHEGRNVAYLLVVQLVAECRHPAAAVRHLRDHPGGIGDAREVGAAVAAGSLCAVAPEQLAAKTVAPAAASPSVASHRLLHRRAPCLHRAGSLGRADRAVARKSQSSSPCAVAWRLFPWERKTTYCCPSCSKNDAVLFAPAPSGSSRAGCRSARRTPRARRCCGRGRRGSPSSCSSPSNRPGGTALPFLFAGERVDSGERARRRGPGGAGDHAADVELALLPFLAGHRHLARRLHGGADVEHVRLRVVADRPSVHAALRAGRDGDEPPDPGRRVDLLRGHDLEVLLLGRERLLDPLDLALRDGPWGMNSLFRGMGWVFAVCWLASCGTASRRSRRAARRSPGRACRASRSCPPARRPCGRPRR